MGSSQSKSHQLSKKPSITNRLHRSVFHEDLTDSNPSSAQEPPLSHPSSHPFLPVPPPPIPKHPQTTLSGTKFRINPHRHLLHESRDEYKLRKARLALANKLQAVRPKSPLLERVHPKTGKVMTAEEGFAGTPREVNQKNKWVKEKKGYRDGGPPRKGYLDSQDIREEEEDEEGEGDGEMIDMDRMDGLVKVKEFEGMWGRRYT